MKTVRENVKYCTLCETTETLKEFKSHYICEACVKEVLINKKEKGKS